LVYGSGGWKSKVNVLAGSVPPYRALWGECVAGSLLAPGSFGCSFGLLMAFSLQPQLLFLPWISALGPNFSFFLFFSFFFFLFLKFLFF
jgi:hypothetical protein